MSFIQSRAESAGARSSSWRYFVAGIFSGAAAVLILIGSAGSQQPATDRQANATLASLIELAQSANPSIAAARNRVAAARARIRPAGARPDPMLMLGAINVPVRNLSFTDEDMTMKMVGIEQNLPYPGKLGLRRKVAELEADAAAATAESVRLGVVRDVKNVYYELSYIDAALSVAERNSSLLIDIARLANGRYSAGVGMQPDVLRATLEATRLNDGANSLREERRAMLAKLNGLVARASETPIDAPSIPQPLVRAAVSASADIRFASQDLGASVTGSTLPSLAELQSLAVRTNPVVRARAAMVAVGNAEVALARKEFLPDVDLSIQYGQRSGSAIMASGERVSRSDMISALVTIPIPLQRARKQNASVAASEADLSALEAEQRDAENTAQAEVARLYSDIAHSRTQLALYVKAIIPQGQATLASSTASYQSGVGDLLPVLTAQTTLFELETSYHRALTDFAQKIAELEAVVGKELLP
jgi:cobalt-zinc-cadmium efflux system outer membrane protein